MVRKRSGQGERLRGILGWTHWPSYVWRRIPPGEGAVGIVTRSALHSGYIFSLLAVAVDLGLMAVLRLPWNHLLLLGHLLWISGLISLILLHPRFLEHLDGRPLQRLGWANWLTLLRVSFLPPLLYLLLLRQWGPALVGYVVLGLTDVADGAVARRRKEESKLGFVFDPFGDILFHLGILLSLTWTGILSWWTGSLVLTRYGLLLVGTLALYLLKGEIWIQPTPFGKGTGLVISTLTALLLLLLGLGQASETRVLWIDRALFVLFASCVVHVLVIGWINFRRPQEGGVAVYRRGWGLLLGHDRAQRERDGGSGGGTDTRHEG